MAEDFKFVLGRETGPGRIETIRGCNTEEEMRNLYRNLLIQSGFDSGYFPYQRRGDGERSYGLLMALAFEVEEKFREERERNQNADISRLVM